MRAVDGYDTALICTNGHIINDSFMSLPDFNAAFCSRCGAAGIHQCIECSTDIRGRYFSSKVFVSTYTAPDYCHNCGKPYPWTRDRIETAKEFLQELDELGDDREKLANSLPDLISDTPRTTLAAERWRKALAKVGEHVGVALRELIVEIASESAKKIMFP